MHSRWLQKIPPPLLPVAGFLGIIGLGTLALALLPMVHGQRLPLIDALFMATSATCVTGLSLYDIGTQFTVWGQGVILVLIQVGGLGIMLLSTAFLMALGHRISFRSRFLLQDTYTHGPTAHLTHLMRNILLFTFVFETAGALLLFLRFHADYPGLQAAYVAVFHSVSAFCNAGFSLFPDSLVGFRGDPLVNLTMAALIIGGGIGFLVLHETALALRNRKRWRMLSLHTKLALSTTAALLAGGTLLFLLSEWSETLARLPLGTKLLASFFQSVTTRTAGFNSLDFAAMDNQTLLATLMLMFIGASPGSTGGGIKTTTLGVLAAVSRARLVGSPTVHAFQRTIPEETLRRAFSIFVLAVVVILLGTYLLLWSELRDVAYAASRGRFLELLFEATSAFGTVGLSMGATPTLSFWGKWIIICLMFTGRLGPLVLAMAIQPRGKRSFYEFAEEPAMIG
ncbi:trk system potassium uptake protein TrkH [Desulfacinum hydrothermale DSM 13146]|uniref:Trk system potassium uptake protein TrkH n=1 Tax=Desulfacinum hydrothermale DSM 13146 TaxID=1121390 RepID=A0A1W1WX32_9BACT|nr:TrkH family potassium uptake protein [Desulfacinum hydrothermale]SMC16194.1 trk system potassium uptake protein TrkH [Desulfacinum hydrothermale DSM 13146]